MTAVAEDDYRIRMTAEDEASRELDDLGEQATETAEDVEQAGDEAADSGDRAQESAQGFEEVANELVPLEDYGLGAKAGFLAAGAGAVTGAQQVGQMTIELSQAAGELATTAKQFNLSTNELRKWEVAGKLAGASSNQLRDAIKELSTRMGEARLEGKNTTQALDAMGLTFADLDADIDNTDAVFRELLERLAQIDSDMKRTAVASKAFGEEAGPALARMVQDGTQGLRELESKAQDTAATFSEDTVEASQELNTEITELKETFKQMKIDGLDEMIPRLKEGTEILREWGPHLMDRGQEVQKVQFWWAHAAKAGSDWLGVTEALTGAQQEQAETTTGTLDTARNAAKEMGLLEKQMEALNADVALSVPNFGRLGEALGGASDQALKWGENILESAKTGFQNYAKWVQEMEKADEQADKAAAAEARRRRIANEASALRIEALQVENEKEAARLRHKARIVEIEGQDLAQKEEELRKLESKRKKEKQIAEIEQEKIDRLKEWRDSAVGWLEDTSDAASDTADSFVQMGKDLLFADETADEQDVDKESEEIAKGAKDARDRFRELSSEIESFSGSERTFRSIAGGFAGIVGEMSNLGAEIQRVNEKFEGTKAGAKGAAAAASTFSSVGAEAASVIGEGYREQAGIRAAFETAAGVAATASALMGNPAAAAAAAQHFAAAALFGAIAGGAGKNPNAESDAGGAPAGGGGGAAGGSPSRTASPSPGRAENAPEQPRAPINLMVDLRESRHYGRTGPQAEKDISRAAEKGAAQVFK